MGGGNEIRFKLRRGHVNTAGQKPVKISSVSFCVGALGGTEIGNGPPSEKEREARTHSIERNGKRAFSYLRIDRFVKAGAFRFKGLVNSRGMARRAPTVQLF